LYISPRINTTPSYLITVHISLPNNNTKGYSNYTQFTVVVGHWISAVWHATLLFVSLFNDISTTTQTIQGKILGWGHIRKWQNMQEVMVPQISWRNWQASCNTQCALLVPSVRIECTNHQIMMFFGTYFDG